MSRKSLRALSPFFFLALTLLLLSQVQEASAQTSRSFTNSNNSETWFAFNSWTTNRWAGFADGVDPTAGNGLVNDLAVFGNPTNPVLSTILLDRGVTSTLTLGGISFSSSNTAYQFDASGAGDVKILLGGLNVNTTTGALIGTGSRVLVLSDASTQDVTFGVLGTSKLDLELNTSGAQGEIYVKAGRLMTIHSVISEATAGKGITLTGGGTLSLTNANTYTGTTIVNNGTLLVNANDRLASGGLAVDGAAAVYNIQAFNESLGAVSLRNGGTLSGTGTLTGTSYAFESGTASLNLAGASAALTKTTSGIVTMTGTNTFGGGTTLTAGTIRAGSNAAFGSGAIAINGGKISSNGTTARSFANNYTLGGDAELGDATDNGALTFSGAGTLTGNRTLTINSGVTLSGAIGETGGAQGLTKTGTATLTLSGNNTYTGGTTVTAGNLVLGASERLANTGAVTVSGGTFDIAGFNETVGAVSLTSGSIIGGAGNLTGTSYGVQSGSISAILAGSGALTKTTAGTVTLSGANSYTGGTTVSLGTLAFGASNVLANGGSVDVAGGTLDISTFSDTVGAVTLTSGTIAGTTGILTGTSYGVQSGSVTAILGGAGVALTKTTGGTVTLSGANTYGGGTNVNAGTLALGASNVLADGSAVTVSGGTLSIAGNSDSVGLVTLNSGSITGSTGVLTGTDYDVKSGSITAILGGAGVALTKTTAGTVTLSGANTYTGATTITAGTLALGNSDVLSNSSAVNVNGGTLDIGANSDSVAQLTLNSGSITGTSGVLTATDFDVKSGTISAILGGSGVALTKTTAGSVTLSGANTYTGGTIVSAGTLTLGNSNVLADVGAVTINGGSTLAIDGNSDTVGQVTLTNGSITGTTGVLTASDYDVKSGSISAILAGSGVALTKTTTGTVTLSGANTYTGGTVVSSGTLALGNSNVLADAGAVTVSGGTLSIGANSDTVGTVTLNSGTISGTTGTLTGSSYAFRSGSVSANLGGSGALNKTTAGGVTLSGTNSTVGAVSVSAGTLELASGASLNAGLVTVSSGATLDIDGTLLTASGVTIDSGAALMGAGTINGNVDVNGSINPGNSPGTLAIVGNLNLGSSSILNFELLQNNQTAGGGVNDLITVNGDLVLDGTLNIPDPSTILNWTTNGTFANPLSWTLFTFTGNITDNGLNLGNLPVLSGTPAPQEWKLQIVLGPSGGGSVNLNAVPEPSAAMLIGGILAGAACLRRRRAV